ncbi:hypothetical protein RvY_18386 [Ramazzottius varieornatus]|uniref:Uncharacterized protein n=1 Tax=Ramazzottius varieornatus TaxID=947166 RepID=A0A1D1W5K3_RAMVA|nr:hypothetical protein RvY_18386 [Ramazzottius varieornatus]
MPPKRSRKAKGFPPKRKDPGSSMKHSIALRPKYVRRNAKVADDAISEASDQTKCDLNYETVSEDEVKVSDRQGSSVFEVPLSPPQKRLRPDDIPSSLNELPDQQIALAKAQLNGERIKAFSSAVSSSVYHQPSE